jgi:hypothetical protein
LRNVLTRLINLLLAVERFCDALRQTIIHEQ